MQRGRENSPKSKCIIVSWLMTWCWAEWMTSACLPPAGSSDLWIKSEAVKPPAIMIQSPCDIKDYNRSNFAEIFTLSHFQGNYIRPLKLCLFIWRTFSSQHQNIHILLSRSESVMKSDAPRVKPPCPDITACSEPCCLWEMRIWTCCSLLI